MASDHLLIKVQSISGHGIDMIMPECSSSGMNKVNSNMTTMPVFWRPEHVWND